MKPETRQAIIKWIVQSILGLIAYAGVLFLSAGRLDWVWGWVILGVVGAFLAAHPLILVPINPDLLAEREKGSQDRPVKAWDKQITALAGGLMIASWVVAGLDVHFHWTAGLPLGYHLAGLLVMVLGYALFLWAMASNAFFSEGVRIQTERGHAVASRSPYRFVRHPRYIGTILSQVSTAFLLGSPWALIPSLTACALYVVRTYLEDQTLRQELPGYAEYAQRTRYRLLPGVWQPVNALIQEHLARRPGMEPRDIYKLLYQGVRGPEHLIASPATFAERLTAEWKALDQTDSDPLWETIRPDGSLLRLNLRPYKAQGGDLDSLVAACLDTARRFWGTQADLQQIWVGFLGMCRENPLPGPALEDVKLFTSWLEVNGFPAVHHSERYRILYQPAYRLLAADILASTK